MKLRRRKKKRLTQFTTTLSGPDVVAEIPLEQVRVPAGAYVGAPSEASQQVGACRYVTIGGRRTCLTGGHNHTGSLKEGERRALYFGTARLGRRRRRAIPADVGNAKIGTASNMAGT